MKLAKHPKCHNATISTFAQEIYFRENDSISSVHLRKNHTLIAIGLQYLIFAPPFVEGFAPCYRTAVLSVSRVCLSVCR